MSFLPRAVGIGFALLLATPLLTSCTNAEEKAADALCRDFHWDPGHADADNVRRLKYVMGRYDFEDSPDQVIDQARRQCPDNIAYYDRYVADLFRQIDNQVGPASLPTTSTRDLLTSRGVSDDMVLRLARVADRTGYTGAPGTPLTFADAQFFAATVISVCDDVAWGRLTWADAIERDEYDGILPADARRMNGYTRTVFCPGLS